jgi:hypothetical protein
VVAPNEPLEIFPKFYAAEVLLTVLQKQWVLGIRPLPALQIPLFSLASPQATFHHNSTLILASGRFSFPSTLTLSKSCDE